MAVRGPQPNTDSILLVDEGASASLSLGLFFHLWSEKPCPEPRELRIGIGDLSCLSSSLHECGPGHPGTVDQVEGGNGSCSRDFGGSGLQSPEVGLHVSS